MQRYILTGAPGAGKTVLLRRLERAGFAVVEEAATDFHVLAFGAGVAEPHLAPSFIDDILALQRQRERRADAWSDEVVFFDRSPICTLALSEFLGRPPSAALTAEIDRIQREATYQRRVFFLDNLGFVAPTEARRISFADTLQFEAVHAAVYRRLGYELIMLPAGPVEERFDRLRGHLKTPA
jgi:predicted ATPase